MTIAIKRQQIALTLCWILCCNQRCILKWFWEVGERFIVSCDSADKQKQSRKPSC